MSGIGNVQNYFSIDGKAPGFFPSKLANSLIDILGGEKRCRWGILVVD